MFVFQLSQNVVVIVKIGTIEPLKQKMSSMTKHISIIYALVCNTFLCVDLKLLRKTFLTTSSSSLEVLRERSLPSCGTGKVYNGKLFAASEFPLLRKLADIFLKLPLADEDRFILGRREASFLSTCSSKSNMSDFTGCKSIPPLPSSWTRVGPYRLTIWSLKSKTKPIHTSLLFFREIAKRKAYDNASFSKTLVSSFSDLLLQKNFFKYRSS